MYQQANDTSRLMNTGSGEAWAMCNLYSMTTTTDAIQKLVQEWEDAMRNVPPFYAIYPDYSAPIIKQRGDKRVLGFGRWGLPSLKNPVTEKPDRGATNIRHP